MELSRYREMYVIFLAVLVALGARTISAQQPPQAPQFPNSTCQGVFMSYKVKPATPIPPFIRDLPNQPYRFEADLTLTNMGFNEVKNWEAFVGFQHREWLVSASKSVLADGVVLPAPVNGTTLSGFPETTLLNAVETAGDVTKTSVTVSLVGTEFGVRSPEFPLPSNISFPVAGYTCGNVVKLPSNDTLQLCCTENLTAVDLNNVEDRFLPPLPGDVSITYSVVQAFESNYWAEVQISNDNLFGRLDGWNLTWEWKQGEFIYDMRGAHALDQDQTDCLNGLAGQFYKDMDFSTVMTCNRNPVLTDLPPEKFFDPKVGNIPSCCRNGLLLPKLMDPAKSKSVFQLQVYKLPPNVPRDVLEPPANFKLGEKYQCSQPRLIAPFEKPDAANPSRTLSAVKSWQVACNLTGTVDVNNLETVVEKKSGGGCCVSFSGFYNSSAIPCPTCACGCAKETSPTCDPNSQPILIPSYALLTPFDNRSKITDEWTRLNRLASAPKVRPCGDNCGVNINWHIASDFEDSWTARISILNWDAENISDWFAGVELDKAVSGLKQIYTFNGTTVSDIAGSNRNNTIYLEGRDGYNELLLAAEMQRQKLNPGKLQAVILFDKTKTPRINVTGGDGFPTKVIFNGEECVLPSSIPTSFGAPRSVPMALWTLVTVVLATLVMLG